MLWACLHCNLELVRLLCSFAQQLRVPPVVLARVTNHFGHSPLMLACAKIPARVGSSNGENVRRVSRILRRDKQMLYFSVNRDLRL